MLEALQTRLGLSATGVVEMSVHYLGYQNGLSTEAEKDAPEPRVGKAK